MRFVVAGTFARSIAALDGADRRTVQCAAFGFQMNPSHPGLRLHRLVHGRDPGFWSLSVNKDLRIIVHRDRSEVVFCYADHHDKAYAWAERRKLGRHPESGALSFVEVEPTRELGAAPPGRRAGPDRLAGEGRRPRGGAPPPSSAPVVGLHRRLRTRARAAAPLPHGANRFRGDPSARPLAQLLQLAQRVGRSSNAPMRPQSFGAPPASTCRSADAEAAQDRGVRLDRKLVALALLAAPWPLLASLAAAHGVSDRVAVALVAGCVGSLLLAGAVVLAACAVRAAARRAARESERVRDRIRSGRLDLRCDLAAVDPALRPILRAGQEALEALSVPFEEATSALVRIARGEAPGALPSSRGGQFDLQRNAIAEIAAFVDLRAEDIRAILGGVGGRCRDAAGETGSAPGA